MSDDLKKFCRNAALLTVIVILLDYAIGATLEHFYFKSSTNWRLRTTYAINGTQADMLAFGSSRATRHYAPKVFEDGLHVSFYNCGRDAQDLTYGVAVLSAILNRYDPKYVILDLLPNEFTAADNDRLASLLPYYKNEAIRPFLDYKSKTEGIKLLSHIYPYNSMPAVIFPDALQRNRVEDDYHGYVPFDETMPPQEPELYEEKGVLNKEKQVMLERLLGELEKREIKSAVVMSPLYNVVKNSVTSKTAAEICAKFTLTRFVDYTNSDAFRDYSLFKDEWHLNEKGALKFSKDLMQKLEFTGAK